MFTSEELHEIIDAIKSETKQKLTPTLVSNIGPKDLGQKDNSDLANEFEVLVAAAKNYESTLFCVRT